MKVKVKESKITDKERAVFVRVGSIGGKKVFEKRGKEHMSKIGRKGGLNRWPKKGRQNGKVKNGKHKQRSA